MPELVNWRPRDTSEDVDVPWKISIQLSGSTKNRDESADFQVRDQGSTVLLWPLSKAAEEWVEENLPEDPTTWNGAVVIEDRDAPDILAGLALDGLSVRPG